eukprot:Phypoly_transcript_00058.p1 GENE.Phypoly_transcript_00058~~Phypoly_transcript_00058.p1  ORF type:complete len:2549 (-),score=561.62 Phypoly_transcript_00058:70-7716(-)
MAQAETVTFRVGQEVWIPHAKEGWVCGEIQSIDAGGKNEIVVLPEDGGEEIKVTKDKALMKNPEILEGVPDLAQLSYMHEPGILYNLQTRYRIDTIYTYIGKILIAINPYARLALFGKDMIRAYFGQPLGALAPHVYAIAQDAFKDMRIEGTSQSILVSGESGAGKTETTKFLLQYFAAMGNLLKSQSNPHHKGKSETRVFDSKSIEERVLESTPLLEAFGNAKTLRNDNSSRFGKFIEIHFDEGGFILGARIQTYLLEKSRIFKQVQNERNYHIFYQFLTGATDEMRSKYNLKDSRAYAYLNQSDCLTIDGVSDEETFKHTLTAMTVSGGINDEEKQDVFCLLATVLWLGNITFLKKRYDDTVEINSPEALQTVAKLIQCSELDLGKALTTRTVQMKNEKLTVPLTIEQSMSARDSLSMLLYSQMFDWLVGRINKSIHQIGKSKFFIGVLDIYGFESFTKNSFEQFCINYANEKLQQLFNQHVFKEEQQEYMKEKISWSYIDFVDNQDTLDLIEKKPICILSLLDEESQFPKATSLTLASKLTNALASHPKFEKPRFSNKTGNFTILHYAGKVTYDTETFLDKNKDFVLPEQIALLRSCKNKFFSSLLPAHLTSDQQYKFVSVGSQFSVSLAGLMKTICSTSPHYIRCIKPNPSKSPQVFVKDDVMHQLKCGGVMESVRICCAGYPTRRPIDQFFDRYKILHPQPQKLGPSPIPKQVVPALLAALELPEDKFKLGLTKVFLRAGLIAKLEDMRFAKLTQACTEIQRRYRGFYAQRAFKALRVASVITQTYVRRLVAQLELRHLRERSAATAIQTFYRAVTCKNTFQALRNGAIAVQRAIKSAASRRELAELRYSWSVLSLQTIIRKCLDRREYVRKIKGIRRLQAKWRGKLARKQYVQLRIEARSVRSLQNAKSQLESKVEEIQIRLSVEARVRQNAEKEKEELVKALEESKEKHVQELVEAKKKFSVSSDEYKHLASLLEQARQEVTVLQEAKASLERQCLQQTEAEATYQKQIHALLVDLNAQKELVQSKQTEVDNVKWALSQLEKEKVRLESHAEDLKGFYENQIRDIKNQKEDMETTQNEFKAEVRKWQETAKATAAKKSGLEIEVAALQQRMVVEQETNAALQQQVTALLQAASELESKHEDSASLISQLQRDILANSDKEREKDEEREAAAKTSEKNREEQDQKWQAKWAQREEEHAKKWGEVTQQWDEKEKQWVEKEKQWSDKDREWQERERQWAELDAAKDTKTNEQWLERKQEYQKKWNDQERVWAEKERKWAENERQWTDNQRQWAEKERQWAITGLEKEVRSNEEWAGRMSDHEKNWNARWNQREDQFNAKLNEERAKWNEKEIEWTNTERQWAEKERKWAEEARQWAEKERQRAEQQIANEALLNEQWLAKLLAQENAWNEKWVEREDEQEKKWNEQERVRAEEALEKDQKLIAQEKLWSDRLAYETQKAEEHTRKASLEKHELRATIAQLEEARDAQTQQFHALQAQSLIMEAERQRAQVQLAERERESVALQTKLAQVQEKYKVGMERLSAEKQQLGEQLDKFSMEKMREGIEANAKTMVDAAKHELDISNLEKDIIRLKMEADRIAQAHELEEKNWRRTEAELKENLARVDSELKQHQALRAKFEGEFFGLKEKSSTATQETYYLKEVNSQLQNNIQRFEAELAEKKTLCESLTQECDATKKAQSALQLENQKLNDKITGMEQIIQSMDKKKNKLKEYEEAVAGKLEAKKAEITELKANQAKELAALQRTIDEQRDKISNHSTDLMKHQFMVQQAETNANRYKEDLEKAKEETKKLSKKHKKSKEKSAAKLVEETSGLKVQIELLKKELAELGDKSKAKDKEKDKQKERVREKEAEGDKALKSLQEKNAELQTEVTRVREESTNFAEENVKLKRDYGQALADNEKLLADNAELVNQLQKLYDDLQNRPLHPRDVSEDLDQSNDLSRSVGGYSSGRVSPKTTEEINDSLNNWNAEDAEVSKSTASFLEQQAMQDLIQKQKLELNKANETRLSLEANVRLLTDEKVLAAQRQQRVEGELAEMKKLYSPLKQKSEKLKMIEKINDAKETEYQKLARQIGYEPTPTIIIFRELTNFGDHRHHDFVKLIYHQITYWNIVEFEDLPVLQAVVNSYSNLITKYAQDLDVLTHIFSGASLLLYMLYKNRGADLEDIIAVEPLDVKQAVQDETKNRARSSGSFSVSSLTLAPIGSLGRSSAYSSSDARDALITSRAPTPDVSNFSHSVTNSGSYFPSSPSPTPRGGDSGNSSGTFDRGGSAKLQFRPLRSSGDFFSQLKALVGKCFGLLLAFVASRLDPLLDQTILVENFSAKKRNELPSLRPVISFLQKTLSVFQVNLVHLSLSQQFFSEVFARINNILMNGVLLRQQFCTETFGAYLKTQIELIQSTADEMGQMWIGDVTACFQGIKQIASVLALSNKNSLAEDKIRKATCPALNSLQLRQLLSMFTPGEFGKRVPIPVINAIGARTPHSDTDRILLDVNVVRPFPIKVLHYFEVEDMLKTATTPTVRSLVESISAGKI